MQSYQEGYLVFTFCTELLINHSVPVIIFLQQRVKDVQQQSLNPIMLKLPLFPYFSSTGDTAAPGTPCPLPP